MSKCNNCGKINDDGKKFCTECGAKLVAEQQLNVNNHTKQYKLVVGPNTSQIISDKGDRGDAVNAFQRIITQYSTNGWSYHSMEPITTSQTKGCVFRETIVSTFYMLIFEREL